MNSGIKIVSIGIIWGLSQASVLLLVFFFAGHMRSLFFRRVLISFFAGRVLYEVESIFRALLLSTFAALAHSMLVASILAQLNLVSQAQWNSDIAAFLLLAPI